MGDISKKYLKLKTLNPKHEIRNHKKIYDLFRGFVSS